jgi:hypothetical protein
MEKRWYQQGTVISAIITVMLGVAAIWLPADSKLLSSLTVMGAGVTTYYLRRSQEATKTAVRESAAETQTQVKEASNGR